MSGPFYPNARPILGRSIVLFGDSRTADQNVVQGAPAFINRWTNVSWFARANAMNNWPFSMLANSGIGGNTTSQMLARISTDVLAYSPSCVTVFGGTNDFTGSATPSVAAAEVALAYSNLVSIYTICKSLGIYVFALSETPDSASSLVKQQQKIVLNNQLREYWANTNGGEFVDFYSVLVNPTDTTGQPLANVTRDGLHFSVLGGEKTGSLLSKHFSRFAGNGSLALTSSLLEYFGNTSLGDQVNQNPFMTGTSGTVNSPQTGTLPTSYTSSGTCPAALSIESRADGLGNNIVCAASATGAQSVSIGINMPQAYLVPGGTYVGEGELQIISPSNTLIECSVNFSASNGNAQLTGFGSQYDSHGYYSEAATTMRFRTPPLVLPAGSYGGTSATLLMSFTATGTATAKLGRLSWRRIA